MAAAEAVGRRYGRADRVDQLAGALRGGAARTISRAIEPACRSSPRVAKDLGEPRLRPLVHDLRRRQRLRGIHAHVERGVVGVREPALGDVELERGDPEVEIDARPARLPSAASPARTSAKSPARKRGWGTPARSRSRRIARSAAGSRSTQIELAARAEALGDGAGVPAAAEGAVDDGVAGTRIEELDELGLEDGNVLGAHEDQCRRRHHGRFRRRDHPAPPAASSSDIRSV